MPFQLLFCLRGGTITHTYTRGASACDRVVVASREKSKNAAAGCGALSSPERLPALPGLVLVQARRGLGAAPREP